MTFKLQRLVGCCAHKVHATRRAGIHDQLNSHTSVAHTTGTTIHTYGTVLLINWPAFKLVKPLSLPVPVKLLAELFNMARLQLSAGQVRAGQQSRKLVGLAVCPSSDEQ